MKYLVLTLLILGACTTSQKEGPKTTPAPVESPTESDARPVSPYTVQPCYCMKIFRPVCVDGRTFGNSCEAECTGAKTWQEGPCVQEKD